MDDLWSQVCRGPALFVHDLVLRNRFAHSKIANLGVQVVVEEYVVKLYIAVDDPAAVDVRQSVHDLPKHIPRLGRVEFALLLDVFKEVAVGCVLHDDVQMAESFEDLVQSTSSCAAMYRITLGWCMRFCMSTS